MFGIGTPEILIIVVVALLIFGPSKLPELGKTLGKGIREFKKASTDLKDQINPLNEDEHNTGSPELIEDKKGGKKPVKKRASKTSTNKTAGVRPKAITAKRPKTKTVKQKSE